MMEEHHEEASKIIPAELYNNVGVLRLQIGKVEEAKTAFDKALTNCELTLKSDPCPNKVVYQALHITLRFNLGYWYEQ